MLAADETSAIPAENGLERARALRGNAAPQALSILDLEIEAYSSADAQFSGQETRYLAELLELRTQILRDQGRFDPAAADAERFGELAESIGRAEMRAGARYLQGTLRAEQGDIAGAVEHFHGARRILEAADLPDELARINNALGVAHNFIPDYQRARQYYRRALALARRTGDEALENSVLGNLALTISELDGPEAGLIAHRRAHAFAQRRGDSSGMAYQLANICSRLVQAARLAEADSTCPDALDQVSTLGHPRIEAGARMSMGDLRLAQGRFESAERHYLEALAMAEQSVPSIRIDLLGKLAGLNEQIERPVAALEFFKRMFGLREEHLEQQRATMIEELEVRYRIEQQEREIDLLQLNSELAAAELKQQTRMLTVSGIALALVSVLALLAWRGLRAKSVLERELTARNRELERALETIGKLAREDSLTGLLNRRVFLSMARREIERHGRTDRPVSIVMADIDYFKELNDRHGHPVGDQVLVEVARRMRRVLRKYDIVCRWGGEEFIFLLPLTDCRGARMMARRIRKEIAVTAIETSGGPMRPTLTFGVAAVDSDIDAAILAADRAMYMGKNAGRDRIVEGERWCQSA